MSSTPSPEYPQSATQPQNWGQPAAPVKKKRNWKKWGIPAIAFLVGVGMGSAGGNDDASTATSQPTATVTKTVGGNSSAQPAATVTATATVTAEAQAQPSQTAEKGTDSSTELASGTFEVGTGKDMAPGKYKLEPEDGSSCYWATLKDADGSFESIIANGNITGPTIVNIRPQVNYFQSNGCKVSKA